MTGRAVPVRGAQRYDLEDLRSLQRQHVVLQLRRQGQDGQVGHRDVHGLSGEEELPALRRPGKGQVLISAAPAVRRPDDRTGAT